MVEIEIYKSLGDFECESKLMKSHECQKNTVDYNCTLYLCKVQVKPLNKRWMRIKGIVHFWKFAYLLTIVSFFLRNYSSNVQCSFSFSFLKIVKLIIVPSNFANWLCGHQLMGINHFVSIYWKGSRARVWTRKQREREILPITAMATVMDKTAERKLNLDI